MILGITASSGAGGGGGGGIPDSAVTNVLTAPDAFENAAWVKTSLTVTADATTGPPGSTDGFGDKINGIAGGAQIYQGPAITLVTSDAVAFRIRMKADANCNITMRLQGVSNGANNSIADLICAVTTAWQTFSMDRTVLGNDTGLYAVISPATATPFYVALAVFGKGTL